MLNSKEQLDKFEDKRSIKIGNFEYFPDTKTVEYEGVKFKYICDYSNDEFYSRLIFLSRTGSTEKLRPKIVQYIKKMLDEYFKKKLEDNSAKEKADDSRAEERSLSLEEIEEKAKKKFLDSDPDSDIEIKKEKNFIIIVKLAGKKAVYEYSGQGVFFAKPIESNIIAGEDDEHVEIMRFIARLLKKNNL
ncbi:MAG: hypothetical protein U9R06_02570 [Patescibacteria group bacterium]|nr:hypothetical protein [Patescibacteria group bacterium]